MYTFHFSDAIQQVGTVQAVEAAKQSSSLSAVPIVHSQAESSSAEGTKDASILQLLVLRNSCKLKKTGDSEEDRRRPVARTFTNWLQAFCIYCNIMTEKYPGLAPKLFRHLDIVLEAYRSYGRVAWYIYDDRFRQKMAVQKTLSWGQKDVDLWMGMLMPRPLSNFSNQKSQVNAQGQSNAQNKYNTCWAYNESHCKWQALCRFKHKCAQCGGAHPAFRCVKKFQGIGRGGARNQQGKITHPGEATRNCQAYQYYPVVEGAGAVDIEPTSASHNRYPPGVEQGAWLWRVANETIKRSTKGLGKVVVRRSEVRRQEARFVNDETGRRVETGSRNRSPGTGEGRQQEFKSIRR
ncbi:hypothetical protein XELAEV_18033432mg [Xenopus laevis]|uniref:C3H1-type domain-containing protein n=1 Tax=Xenopus laevis TaxID=8355 RepID=A0A974CJJ1_XENLA|nr:hypothetical protein XELAEV_18033432mg [Xenopus laevis]